MRRVVLLALVGSLGVVSGLCGCGPIISSYLIISAQADLDGAKAAEAEKYAVYEYTAASEYLHKAREEQGYADFGPAIDYAGKAHELAQKATTRASDEKKRLSETPDAEWQAPAEDAPTDQPQVIIKKKKPAAGDDVKVKVVPIPGDPGTAPPK
jgi:hypothetical protein